MEQGFGQLQGGGWAGPAWTVQQHSHLTDGFCYCCPGLGLKVQGLYIEYFRVKAGTISAVTHFPQEWEQKEAALKEAHKHI